MGKKKAPPPPPRLLFEGAHVDSDGQVWLPRPPTFPGRLSEGFVRLFAGADDDEDEEEGCDC